MLTFTVTPRFGEIDGLGHINNNVVPTWFEAARNPFFRFFNPDLDLRHWDLILARFEVDFLNQMFYGKDVEIRSSISRIGRSSFEIYQEAWQENKLGAKGTTVIVHYNFTTQKSQTISKEIRMMLEAHILQQIQ